MEGNWQRKAFVAKNEGVTLVELLCAIAVVGIIAVALHSQVYGSSQKVNEIKAKAYIFEIQALQARHWLLTGLYLPLSSLPSVPIDGVTVSENKVSKNTYEITFSMGFYTNGDKCKTLVLTPQGVTPRSCM
jgi:prepilin-type N-terminal cleavage/methylation domain-containing protein